MRIVSRGGSPGLWTGTIQFDNGELEIHVIERHERPTDAEFLALAAGRNELFNYGAREFWETGQKERKQ